MLNLFRKFFKNSTGPLPVFINQYEIPSFPYAVMNVLNMLRDPESSMNEIAVQIEIDPGMHIKVLRVVNSASFGLSSRVANIPHAIVLMGRSRLESLLLSVVVKDVVATTGCAFFNETEFWLNSARRASLARALAERFNPATQAESFTAGLLQDIAVPLLMMAKGESYASVYNEWKSSPGSSLDVLEQEALGYHHAGIGAMMIKQWGLPDSLAESIADHHKVSEDDSDLAVRLMSFIRDDEEGTGTDTVLDICSTQHGVDSSWINKTVQSAFENAKEFSNILK